MPRKNTPVGAEKTEVGHVPGTETPTEPNPKRGTVGALIKELLMDAGLTYAEIVARVIAEHPQANTSARSVASTAAVLRKGGAEVPKRHARATS